jgi:hypothetical protein
VSVLDAVVAVVAGGLLVGWYGVAAVGAALVLGVAVRRFEGWPALAAVSMLMVGAGLSWDRITRESWANEWRQGWSLAVIACVVAALATGLATRRARPRHEETARERPRRSARAPEPADAAPSA